MTNYLDYSLILAYVEGWHMDIPCHINHLFHKQYYLSCIFQSYTQWIAYMEGWQMDKPCHLNHGPFYFSNYTHVACQ